VTLRIVYVYYMCPHTTICVSSYYYMCPHTTICVPPHQCGGGVNIAGDNTSQSASAPQGVVRRDCVTEGRGWGVGFCKLGDLIDALIADA
jgi:hypothetical protein